LFVEKGAANLSFGWDYLALKSTILGKFTPNFGIREQMDALEGL
jgi:hypothetical protein